MMISFLLHTLISHNIKIEMNNMDYDGTFQGVGFIRQQVNSRFSKGVGRRIFHKDKIVLARQLDRTLDSYSPYFLHCKVQRIIRRISNKWYFPKWIIKTIKI